MTDFVHLHLHTEYSLLDGAVRILQEIADPDGVDDNDPTKKDPNKTKKIHPLSQALKDRGMDAVAITDHGNMYGVHSFVSVLRSDGIKPIIGEEFYVAEDMYVKTPEVLKQRYHLILLAKNKTGYQNLMLLSSLAFVDGYYMKPRIDMKHVKEHSEGLICLSACLAGKIPKLLSQGRYEEAKKTAIEMRDMFAPGDFYIELQDHSLPEEKRILPDLKRLAREIGVKVVATNDVHYIEKEDADMQDAMMCITLGCRISDEKTSPRFTTNESYLKTGDEMAELFKDCEEAITSTREIADKCDSEFFVTKSEEHIIPIYENEDMRGRNEEQYLRDLAFEGAKRKYGEITEEIKNRLEYELGVIHDCGFDGYFLVVWDYVHAAKKMGIPVGPGRGSGCGSIVAYCIDITDIEPLKYELLFERFLSKERVSMPDFDVDFCYVRRQEIIDYCVNKYGKDKVSQIIAYSKMSAKAVVKDVARVMDIPYNEAAQWVKEIPNGKVLLTQVLTPGTSSYNEDFKNIYESNEAAKAVIDMAIRLENLPRQTSMHAAGVVICRDPIVDHVALSRNGDVITTQFDKNMVEDIGLLKMDFLGLKTLTDIDEALKLIKLDKGVELDFNKLGYEDKKVFELISSGDCEAIFQLESAGMARFMTQLQPDCLEDVIAGIALFRPGPMQFIDQFLSGKKNPQGVKYAHPLLKDILEKTYGCIVYQEQVMQIAQKLAGFSFGGADIMRRAVSKKKKDILEQQRKIFLYGGVLKGDKTKKKVPGAIANGVSEEVANHLFDQIMKFAEYAFNKSHAAAYTFLTYQTAYLRCYYPTHFIVAVVNNRITDAKEVKHYINYLNRSGVKILPPDINRSQKLFSIDGNDVRYGLMGIKNVGEKAVEFILEERSKNGSFKDIRDLFARCSGQINKRMVESLIKGGAFDSFNKTRSTLMASYERIMDAVDSDRKNKLNGQLSLFDDLIEEEEIRYSELPEYIKSQRLSFEKDVLGMYITGHPLEDYEDTRHEFNFDTSMLYAEEQDENGNTDIALDMSYDGKAVKFGAIVTSFEKKLTKRQQKFATGEFEDKMGTIAYSMFSRTFEKYGYLLEGDAPLKITGKLDLSFENEPKIVVDSIELWENSREPQPVEEKKVSEGILYVLISNIQQKNMLLQLISMFEGDTRVRAQISGTNKVVEFPKRVKFSDEFVSRLKELLGEDRIKYIVK